jgi:hypothetical protein
MRCTARSRVGVVAFTSTCQSSVIRFTLKVWAAVSPKVALPSKVEVVADRGGECGVSGVDTAGAAGSFEHPVALSNSSMMDSRDIGLLPL